MRARSLKFGERIERRRAKLDLSREDFALQFRVSVVSVRNWELGLAKPRKLMRERLENWLNGGQAR